MKDGISWLNDGATIKHIPHVDILAFCSDLAWSVASIFDCNDHIGSGGDKEAELL